MKRSVLFVFVLILLVSCSPAAPEVKPAENVAPPAQPAVAPAATVPAVEEPTTAPPAAVEQTAPPAAPAIDGAAILENQCAECHSANKAKQAPRSREQWDQTVTRMINKGAVLTDAEKAALVDYLAINYGK